MTTKAKLTCPYCQKEQAVEMPVGACRYFTTVYNVAKLSNQNRVTAASFAPGPILNVHQNNDCLPVERDS